MKNKRVQNLIAPDLLRDIIINNKVSFRNVYSDKETFLEEIYDYARMTNSRWKEGEEYIVDSPKWAFMYARYVMRKRWDKAEPYIMKSPYWASQYAFYIIEDFWPEAEPYIKEDSGTYNKYIIKLNEKIALQEYTKEFIADNELNNER